MQLTGFGIPECCLGIPDHGPWAAGGVWGNAYYIHYDYIDLKGVQLSITFIT